MAKIPDGTFKDWQDTQTINAADYKQEREIIRTAVNDIEDKKLAITGDFKGTWNGLQPLEMQEGINAQRIDGITLGQNISFNDITTQGTYRVNSGVYAPTKNPANPDNWWYVQVMRHTDDGFVVQIAFDYRDGTYIRRRHGGTTWDDWKRLGEDARPVAVVQRRAAQWLPGNTWTRLRPDHVNYNDGGMWTLNEDTFTLKEIGWYKFEVQGVFWFNPNAYLDIQLWEVGQMDGTKLTAFGVPGSSPGEQLWVSGSTMLFNPTRNKVYEFVARQTDGAAHEMFYAEMKVIKV